MINLILFVMKRNLYKYFSAPFASGTYVSPVEEVSFELSESELDSVLKEIFSVDERTGFPRGDIQYFLSKDGNPQVKAWLESNLLSPRVKQTGSSIEGVTDDLIAEMSRNEGESSAQYAARLKSYYDEALVNIENLKSNS